MPRSFGAITNRSPGIDWGLDKAIAEIIGRAVSALNATLSDVYTDAKRNAPVRAFLRRTPRGKRLASISVYTGQANARPTGAQIMQAYRRHPVSTKASFARVLASREKPRRINVPEALHPTDIPRDRWGHPTKAQDEFFLASIPGRGQTGGHNNSWQPVIRSKGRIETGDYRQVYNGKLRPVASAARVAGGRVTFSKPPKNPDTGQLESPVEDLLTARGRYELKGKVTRRRASALTQIGETTYVGGTLRESITQVNADALTREGGKIMGYVRAGSAAAYYARYQEFGTHHNRPHPFLRPALYKSRRAFTANVRSFMEGRR